MSRNYKILDNFFVAVLECFRHIKHAKSELFGMVYMLFNHSFIHKTFYNKVSGLIEYRLKTICTKVLKPEEKLRAAVSRTSEADEIEQASPIDLLNNDAEENVSICNMLHSYRRRFTTKFQASSSTY